MRSPKVGMVKEEGQAEVSMREGLEGSRQGSDPAQHSHAHISSVLSHLDMCPYPDLPQGGHRSQSPSCAQQAALTQAQVCLLHESRSEQGCLGEAGQGQLGGSCRPAVHCMKQGAKEGVEGCGQGLEPAPNSRRPSSDAREKLLSCPPRWPQAGFPGPTFSRASTMTHCSKGRGPLSIVRNLFQKNVTGILAQPRHRPKLGGSKGPCYEPAV